jgi:hypothetical protein
MGGEGHSERKPGQGGMAKNVEGIVVVAGNNVALHWWLGIGGMVGGSRGYK